MIRTKDLRAYRNMLKPGQEKRMRVYVTQEGYTSTWVNAIILKVHKHIAEVRYWIRVEGASFPREVLRTDTVLIKDLLRWDMGAQE